jgi:type II secretory pathway component PulF
MNENYSLNTAQRPAQFPVARLLSWLATGIVAVSCLLLAPILISVIPSYSNMFHGLGVELPWPTRVLLATYYWLLPIFFVALAVFVVWKECSTRELRRRFLLTARVFFAALITVGLVAFVLYLPVLTLASKLAIAK